MTRIFQLDKRFGLEALKACSTSEREARLQELESILTARQHAFLQDDASEEEFHAANASILTALREIGHGLEDNHGDFEDLEVWASRTYDGPRLVIEFGLPIQVGVDWGPEKS